MSAAEALKAARAAGIELGLDGDDLALSGSLGRRQPRCSMRSPGTRPRSWRCFGPAVTAGRPRTGRSSSTSGPALSSSMADCRVRRPRPSLRMLRRRMAEPQSGALAGRSLSRLW